MRPKSFLAALAFFTSLATAQTTKAVTGTATYRERVALPVDAVFEVTLEDISRQDAPDAVLARARLERSGQPPFRFSIQYDPRRIIEEHSYVVRARVTVGGNVVFITDQAYPVLTRGSGTDTGMLVMRRATGSDRGATSPLGVLPATFIGELPCAECSGVHYVLNLFADQSFFLRRTWYAGRGDGMPSDDIGRWTLSSDGFVLLLSGSNPPGERFTIERGEVLRKLDPAARGGEPIVSYELRRAAVFEQLEPRLEMRGMFRHMADTAVFTECQTGQRWPVSMERDYRALESAYLQVQRQPGEELLVSLDGQVALKPEVNGAAPGPTLIAERYVGIWPGESCGSTLATASLFETYWKLTRLESKPVIVTESQREPRVIFRARQNQVVGFGGCNSFAGTFRLSAGAMTVTGIAATQKACSHGMDTEAALFSALYRVRSWRIIGQHLELSDAGGKILARLEARASR